jgi:transcriptional regulator with XRE-family HTH domain
VPEFKKATEVTMAKETETGTLDDQRFAVLALQVGQRVRAVRKAANVTQGEIGEAVGTNQGYITALENGAQNPTLRTLCKLADALGVSARMFFPVGAGGLEADEAATLLPEVSARLTSLLRKQTELAEEGNAFLAEIERALASAGKKAEAPSEASPADEPDG